MKTGCAALIGVLVLGLSQRGFANVYSDVYTYESDIRAAADFPSPAASAFSLRGQLTVQHSSGQAIVQLSRVTTSLYNGATNQSGQPYESWSGLPDQAADLLKSFSVELKSGVASGLTGIDGEAEWTVNIKRSIASLLQLDTKDLSNPSFTKLENGLYGPCNVDYTVYHEGKYTIVRKYQDHAACPSYPTAHWTNTPVIPPYCPAGQDKILSSTSQRVYKLEAEKNKIVSIIAEAAIQSQPFKARGELQYIATRQELILQTSDNSAPALSVNSGQPTDLTYRLPGTDFSQGRAPLKQTTTVGLIKRLLKDIAQHLDWKVERDASKLHDERVPQVIYFLTLLERGPLEELFDEYMVGTSYQQDTLRNLFMEILPKVGTSTSILLIRDVILSNRVIESDLLADLLRELPFYVRSPTEQLLGQCEVLFELPETLSSSVAQAGVLSFATLVYKTCQKQCSPQIQDKYVRKYLDLFTEAEDYQHKMVYLEGLSNMEDGKVFEYLEPVIRSHPNKHIRFLAVWATINKAAYHPAQVLKLYWPILADRTASLEMRVAALTMLVVSNPSAGRFFSLHWFMSTEPCPRLKHFYYTTLQSLVNTKDPCYSLMSVNAAQVLRLLPVPAVRHWATGNYILDQGNMELGFGGMAQLFLVANQKTELPSAFYLLLGSHALGQQFSQVSVYMKLEGISSAVKQRLLRIDPATVNLPQLADILSQMKAAPTATEPLHLELLIKVENRVIFCAHLNDSSFHNLADALSIMRQLSREVHLNEQIVEAAILNEHFIPTDVGLSALILISATSISSLRGNMSQVASPTTYLLNNDLEMKVQSTAVNSVMVYNSVVDVWQAVQRSTTLRLDLPLQGTFHVDFSKSSGKFNMRRTPNTYTGMMTHVRSTVFVRGLGVSKMLRANCGSCLPIFTVSRGDQYRQEKGFMDFNVSEVGARLKGDLFDCEHHNGMQALDAAVLDQNYQVFPASRPAVTIVHLLDCWLMVSPPGSCGTELQLLTEKNEPTELEGSIALSSTGSRHTATLAFTHKTGTKTQHTWQATATCQHDNAFYNLSLNVQRDAPDDDVRKLCMEALVKFPTSPTDKYLVRPSQPLSADVWFRWGSDLAPGTGTECLGEELPVHLGFRAETTAEQAEMASVANAQPFQACRAGDADACHRATHEMATLRKYSVNVNYSAPLEPAMFILGRGKDGQLVASLEVSPLRPVVYLTLGTDQFTLDTGRHWLEPLLVNTHYPVLQQAAMALGLINHSDKTEKADG